MSDHLNTILYDDTLLIASFICKARTRFFCCVFFHWQATYHVRNSAINARTPMRMATMVAFCSVCTIFDLRSKVLTFENAQINLAFCSLNRTFVTRNQKLYWIWRNILLTRIAMRMGCSMSVADAQECCCLRCPWVCGITSEVWILMSVADRSCAMPSTME